MTEFGQVVLRNLTKRNILSWMVGVNDYDGWGSTELNSLVDSVNIPVNGTTVEIAPSTKRIHCHILIEIKHHASIHLDIGAIKSHFQHALPANLKPEKGSIYVHVTHVPASTHYTLEYIRKGQNDEDVEEFDLENLAKKVYTVT